jgi:DNA-binding transcriptional LysR family regulator
MFSDFLNNEGLSLQRLHTLVLLSETGSLTKAAGNDPGKQARMSHHLRELGEFFRTPLTERSGQTLKLTPKGQELALIARNHLSTLQTFARSVQTTEREWAIGAGDSVLQWWLIPALGRCGVSPRWSLQNRRTEETVSRVADERLDFGLIRRDAVRNSAAAADIGSIKYAIVVPRRLQRRNLSTKTALAELPHATIGTDGQLTERLRKISSDLGGIFQARLKCDSLGLCLAAVRTGRYAAVLPTFILDEATVASVEIVEADLEELNRPMALIWNPRTLEMLGRNAVETRDALLAALRAEDEERRLEG